MATFQRDKNGNLLDADHNLLGLYPDNQASFDQEGNIINPEDLHKDKIIDATPVEDDTKYLEMVKNFDMGNFIGELSHNTDNALKVLLAMQTNNSPLKKGGDSIAFMADALILATRNMFNTSENTLFDVISAKVSSSPENDTYIIDVADFVKMLPYTDRNYANKILQNATESIKNKNTLEFSPTADKNLSLPWYEALAYTKPEKVDAFSQNDYIAFTPTKIFKMLLISSTVTHGAHYKLSVSTQLVGYTRKLFYILESRKKYKEYPTAKEGIFTMSLEQLKYLLEYPDGYKPNDIKRRILDKAKVEFSKAEGIDFVFDYEDKKIRNTIVGFVFKIYPEGTIIENGLPVKKSAVIENKIDPEEISVSAVLSSLKLSDTEIKDIYKKYKKNGRDMEFLVKAINVVLMNSSIDNKAAYMCAIMDNGLSVDGTSASRKKTDNKFKNFDERKYDMDELEARLLNSDVKN